MAIPSSRQEIQAGIVSCLAEVLATDAVVLAREIADAGGDILINSPEGTVVIAMLEGIWDCTLPGAEDLDPDLFTSVAALTTLIERKRVNL
jgi:hypothetical protein